MGGCAPSMKKALDHPKQHHLFEAREYSPAVMDKDPSLEVIPPTEIISGVSDFSMIVRC